MLQGLMAVVGSYWQTSGCESAAPCSQSKTIIGGCDCDERRCDYWRWPSVVLLHPERAPERRTPQHRRSDIVEL